MTDLVETMARAAWKFENEAHGCDGVESGFRWDFGSNADNYRASARAQLAELEAAGYRVVPVEPTEAMADAGYSVANGCVSGDTAPDSEIAEKTWEVMLSAAPRG